MENNSYLALAKRDLFNAQELFGVTTTGYNVVARLSQQAVEKAMKHSIEEQGNEKYFPLLSTHNTARLYDAIVTLGIIEENRADKKEMLLLKNYYYDTNYPGENYIEIDRETAEEALAFAGEFMEKMFPSV